MMKYFLSYIIDRLFFDINKFLKLVGVCVCLFLSRLRHQYNTDLPGLGIKIGEDSNGSNTYLLSLVTPVNIVNLLGEKKIGL